MKKGKTPMDVMIDHEKRLSRLEIIMYVVATLSGLNLLGVKVFDGFVFFSRIAIP